MGSEKLRENGSNGVRILAFRIASEDSRMRRTAGDRVGNSGISEKNNAISVVRAFSERWTRRSGQSKRKPPMVSRGPESRLSGLTAWGPVPS